MYIEGYPNFEEFKEQILTDFEPLELDSKLSPAAGGNIAKQKGVIPIFPGSGGVILLKEDGTWTFDIAPYAG